MTEQHGLWKTLDSKSKHEKCCLFVSHTLLGVFIMKWPRAALNRALMNLSSSRLGRAADRTGCGDCQPSTWDSRAACWAAWLTGWLLTAL